MINLDEPFGSAFAARRLAAFRQAERHSRRVRRLKIAIMLGSLAAVAGLVAAWAFDPFDRIPGRISVGGATLNGSLITMEEPKLTGYKRDGRPYELLAASAVQNIRTPGVVTLNDINARLTMSDDSVVHLISSMGIYDSKKDVMHLPHQVTVTSDAGYHARLASAYLDFKAGAIISRQPVTVSTRTAVIAAKALAISDSGSIVVFTGDVRSTLIGRGSPNIEKSPK